MSTPAAAARTRLILAFATVYLVWGSSYLASRIGVLTLPPLLFAGVRFVAAGLLMLGYAWLTRERVRPQRGEWRDLGVLALFGFALANGINIFALQWVPSNVSALLNASIPCWIALLTAFGPMSQKLGARAVSGLLIGIAGTALVMQPGAHAGAAPLRWQLLILVGCLCWSISSVYLRRMQSTLPIATLIGWQMLFGGVLLVAAGLTRGEARQWVWSPTGIWTLLYLIVFASCLAHTAYAWLARHTTPISLGSYAYVNPVIATLLGWMLLNEALSGRQLVGMTIVLSGVLLTNWPRALWRGSVTATQEDRR